MPDTYKRLSKGRRWAKTLRWKLSARAIDEETLIEEILASGVLEPGDIVMVHSALSSLGKVVGGPETVCKALQKVLKETGTLLMPSYHQPQPILKMIKEHVLVDLQTAPSTVGKLTETFRNLPGVRRSSHPFSSVCAWGRCATEMTSGHIYTSLICGPGSPLFELLKRSGKYLGLGVDIRIIGLYHVLEDNWDGFPIKVHYPEPFMVRYVDANGLSLERELIVLDPDVARTRIDQHEGTWIRRWLTDHMRSRGILCEFKIGQASCWVVNARSFYDELKSLALEGITIYTTKEQFESRQPLTSVSIRNHGTSTGG